MNEKNNGFFLAVSHIVIVRLSNIVNGLVIRHHLTPFRLYGYFCNTLYLFMSLGLMVKIILRMTKIQEADI